MKNGLYIHGDAIDNALVELSDELGWSREEITQVALKFHKLGFNADETIIIYNGHIA